jgi:hypothetical protein
MGHLLRNGNGGAVILPPTPKTISGRALAHRRLDKRQRACLAADVIEGFVRVKPTVTQIAVMLDVSPAYIAIARRLPLGKRAAISRGWDPTPFAALVHKTVTVPAKVINSTITDADLAVVAEAAE